jgi:hypothetical protein
MLQNAVLDNGIIVLRHGECRRRCSTILPNEFHSSIQGWKLGVVKNKVYTNIWLQLIKLKWQVRKYTLSFGAEGYVFSSMFQKVKSYSI